jgi:hypothetical protein
MGIKNSTEPGIKPRFFSLYNMPKMRVAIDFFHITGYNTENAQKTNRKTGGNDMATIREITGYDLAIREITDMTIREIAEMKRMGYTIKMRYKTRRGVPFHKYFTTAKEARAFNRRAIDAGTQILAYKSI